MCSQAGLATNALFKSFLERLSPLITVSRLTESIPSISRTRLKLFFEPFPKLSTLTKLKSASSNTIEVWLPIKPPPPVINRVAIYNIFMEIL